MDLEVDTKLCCKFVLETVTVYVVFQIKLYKMDRLHLYWTYFAKFQSLRISYENKENRKFLYHYKNQVCMKKQVQQRIINPFVLSLCNCSEVLLIQLISLCYPQRLVKSLSNKPLQLSKKIKLDQHFVESHFSKVIKFRKTINTCRPGGHERQLKKCPSAVRNKLQGN